MDPWADRRVAELLKRHRHICAFFNSSEEEFRVTIPFIREGIRLGSRVVLGLRDRDMAEHPHRLRESGVHVDQLVEDGRLEVIRARDAYFPDGRFDGDGMIETVRSILDAGHRIGFEETRIIGHCECVLQDDRTIKEFLRYEARLNLMLPGYPDIAICAYDSQQIGTTVALEVFRTHPLVIIAGQIVENPYYEPTEKFLAELDARLAS
ncbi:MAG TPA: MEDS domain-containing protein [Gemmatimonadales bacterium]